jgi:uncharacterized protein
MIPDQLSIEDRKVLLVLARKALEEAVTGKPMEPLELEMQSPCLLEPGATFVTLRRKGELRGCIGALEAYQPLAEDVREHAKAAALQDYRFPPITQEELDEISIEISLLTPPQLLEYNNCEDLARILFTKRDGVILKDGARRATFLPQVWEKLPDPVSFLNSLCMKMGLAPDTWQQRKMEVWTYQVEEFHEGNQSLPVFPKSE